MHAKTSYMPHSTIVSAASLLPAGNLFTSLWSHYPHFVIKKKKKKRGIHIQLSHILQIPQQLRSHDICKLMTGSPILSHKPFVEASLNMFARCLCAESIMFALRLKLGSVSWLFAAIIRKNSGLEKRQPIAWTRCVDRYSWMLNHQTYMPNMSSHCLQNCS